MGNAGSNLVVFASCEPIEVGHGRF
jgi:hypothetical protein